MANYYGMTRTNYFRVNNPEDLKKLIGRVVSDEGDIELWEDKDENGNRVFAFGGYSSIIGICPVDNNNDDGEDEDFEGAEYDLFIKELQKLIVDGDAIIITEVGHEKLRYLTAYSMIITKNDVQSIDLDRQSTRKASEMLDNPEYVTKTCY